LEILQTHALDLALMAFLMGFSALFSGSESALFSLSREQLRRFQASPDLLKRVAAGLRDDPEGLLAAILLGNTGVNILYYAVSYQVAAALVREGRAVSGGAFGTGAVIALLALSEVAPKGIAVRRPVMVAQAVALPIHAFCRLTRPVCRVFSAISRRAAGLWPRRAEDATYVSPDELKMLVELSEKQGLIPFDARRMISGVVELGTRMVKEVMVPRVDVTLFDLDEPNDAFLSLVRRTRHKRIPAYQGSIDHIVGVVRARDVLLNPGTPVRRFVRPVLFVPETKTVESMLRTFRETREQMAVVVDEYGGTAGLITVEDVLEQVVGEIGDEYDVPETPVQRLGPDAYRLAGDLNTRAWRDLFELDLGSPDVETLGGFVISLLGRMPREGDQVTYAGIRFTVESVRDHRIGWVRVERVGEPAAEQTADG